LRKPEQSLGTVPTDLNIKTLADTISSYSRFGHYSFSCFTDGEKTVVSKQVAIKQTQVSVEEYQEAKSFFQSILGSQRKNLTLCRNQE
jgi:hypothetical protein